DAAADPSDVRGILGVDHCSGVEFFGCCMDDVGRCQAARAPACRSACLLLSRQQWIADFDWKRGVDRAESWNYRDVVHSSREVGVRGGSVPGVEPCGQAA